jgi:hypothetical protein
MTYDPFDPFNEVPMYTDMFLKFADEAEANAALFTIVPSGFPATKTVPGTKYLVKGTAENDFEDYTTSNPPEGAEVLDSWPEDQEVVDPDAPPQEILVPKYAAVDIIGTIYKPTGEMIQTDEGEVPEMAPLDGWHVNVRHTAEAPELDAYKVAPKSPVRGWA